MLASIATTAVTYAPFARTRPARSVWFPDRPIRALPLAARQRANASAEPSSSATKPKPLSALNHLTVASTDGPLGAVRSRGPRENDCCGRSSAQVMVSSSRLQSRAVWTPVSSSPYACSSSEPDRL